MSVDRSSKDWNGAERLAAISPALSTVVPLRERLATEALAGGELSKIKAEIAEAIQSAASKSGVTPGEIETWIDSFIYLGKPGLMSPVKVSAEACAAKLQGTWQLQSRIANGRPQAATGHLYYDMDPKSLRGRHLVTICSEEPQISRKDPDNTYLLVAMVDLTFVQDGDYAVVVRSKGQLIGNYEHCESCQEIEDEFRLVRYGHEEKMIGMPTAALRGIRSRNGNTGFNHSRVQLGGDTNSLVFANSGMSALGNMARTQDVVDTFGKVSSARPLIAGWQPITEYFESMVNPMRAIAAVEAMGKTDQALHLFQQTPSAPLARFVTREAHDRVVT